MNIEYFQIFQFHRVKTSTCNFSNIWVDKCYTEQKSKVLCLCYWVIFGHIVKSMDDSIEYRYKCCKF